MLPLTAARYPLQKSTTLTCSRRRFPSARLCVSLREMRRQADCICGTFLFLLFSLSLSCKLTSSVLTCDFPRFFFDFVQFSSHCLASLLTSLLLIAPFLVLPFYLSRSSPKNRARCGPHARPTLSSAWLARATHMAGHSYSECAVLPPAGDRVTWPPGRSSTQRARAVLSREPRTRQQSETNRETDRRSHSLCQETRVLSLSLFSPSLLFSLFLPLFPSNSLPALYCLSSLLRPLLLHCHHHRRVCVHEIRRRDFSVTPASFLPSVEFPPREPRASSFQCCVFTRRRSVLGFWGTDCGRTSAGGPPPAEGRKLVVQKVQRSSCLGIPVTTRCRDENG